MSSRDAKTWDLSRASGSCAALCQPGLCGFFPRDRSGPYRRSIWELGWWDGFRGSNTNPKHRLNPDAPCRALFLAILGDSWGTRWYIFIIFHGAYGYIRVIKDIKAGPAWWCTPVCWFDHGLFGESICWCGVSPWRIWVNFTSFLVNFTPELF